MKAQSRLAVVYRKRFSDREQLIVCTHVNKGKRYPYGSEKQGFKRPFTQKLFGVVRV